MDWPRALWALQSKRLFEEKETWADFLRSMLAKDDTKFWAIHSHKSRLIVYTPEPDIYIYIVSTHLADQADKESVLLWRTMQTQRTQHLHLKASLICCSFLLLGEVTKIFE